MTLGGFNGHTVIHKIAVENAWDSSMVIAGISSDSALVSAPNTNFIMYLDSGGDQWLWSKQFGCPGAGNDVRGLAIMSDKVAVLDSST